MICLDYLTLIWNNIWHVFETFGLIGIWYCSAKKESELYFDAFFLNLVFLIWTTRICNPLRLWEISKHLSLFMFESHEINMSSLSSRGNFPLIFLLDQYPIFVSHQDLFKICLQWSHCSFYTTIAQRIQDTL